jgi:hypothetical protein
MIVVVRLEGQKMYFFANMKDFSFYLVSGGVGGVRVCAYQSVEAARGNNTILTVKDRRRSCFFFYTICQNIAGIFS